MRLLTLRLLNAIVLIPILAYLFTLIFAGMVGSKALGGSMIEEYFYCVALLILIFIIKEILYERNVISSIKIILRRYDK